MLKNKSFFNFDFYQDFSWEKFLFKNRYQILLILLGVILVGFGAFLMKKEGNVSQNRVEVLEDATKAQGETSEMVVEVAGAVEKPGVYKLSTGSRIEDLLIAAGGISVDANRDWMEKALNRAAKLADGQKIYIPRESEQTNVLTAKDSGQYQTTSSNFSGQGSGLVNINTASQKELESLKGIGHVYAQNIIEHRPYSTVEELLSKDALKEFVFKKIKDKVTIY